MKKNCFCGRPAAYGVIDKMGFMEPGVLCPSHYITWKNAEWKGFFIFQCLPGGAWVMRKFFKEREVKEKREEVLEEVLETRRGKTIEQAKIETIVSALERHKGRVQETCRELEISKAMFYRQLKRHNIKIKRDAKTQRGVK